MDRVADVAPASQPIFAPVHMAGAEEIAGVFGVKVDTVRGWRGAGAPIYLVGKKFQANYYDLWQWLKGYSDKSTATD